MGCNFLLQETFLTQDPGLRNCRWTLYHLRHQESPSYPSPQLFWGPHLALAPRGNSGGWAGAISLEGRGGAHRAWLPTRKDQGSGQARGAAHRGGGHRRLGESTARRVGHTAHGAGDLGVCAQQAHVGLNKGEVFFLHVGRVSGGPGTPPGLPAVHLSQHTPAHPTPADLHVAHRWVRGFLWPVWQLLVACGLGVEQVGQGAQLEVVPV